MSDKQMLYAVIPDELAGYRLDQVVSRLFSDYSRSRLQEWIKQSRVKVDGAFPPAKTRMAGGESIELRIEQVSGPSEVLAEPVPLDILYEDAHLLVINKTVDLVMHPAAGNWSGTVQNGLLYHEPLLSGIPRAGIVHRLDKDTSGLFVVAKSLKAHKSLVEQLQEHHIKREYLAIVNGTMLSGNTIDKPIARHKIDRKRMAVREGGKQAITHYRLTEKYRTHTLVSVQLETGRTHQIRVHLAHAGFPLLGDHTYGGRPRFPPACTEELRFAVSTFKRQALHAFRLTLEHPESHRVISWQADIPGDMQAMLRLLREDRDIHA